MSWFKKVFGKKAIDPIAKESDPNLAIIAKLEAQVKNLGDENDDLVIDNSDLEARNKKLEATVSSQHKVIKDLQDKLEKAKAKDSVKLTDAQAKKQLTSLKKDKLKSLEAMLKEIPDGAQGAGAVMVLVKKTKRTELRAFKNKADAMEILKQAKKGTIDIVS